MLNKTRKNIRRFE